MKKTFGVALTIPDNEAFTARETLRRMGVHVGDVRRADIWIFDVDDTAAGTLRKVIATMETIFNPNKHELIERPGSRPIAGEVWIAPQEEAMLPSVGGRFLAGVHGVARCVAWQLLDETGSALDRDLLDRAVETFLCNPAFQKAIR